MLKNLLLSLIIVLGFLPPQKPGTAAAEPEPYLVPEAYEIYSQLLPGQWPATEAHAPKLIIRRETVAPFDMCLKPEGESVPVVGPVIADFVSANKKRWTLQQFTMSLPYEFVSSDDLETIFKDGVPGWKPFYDKYPKSGGYNEVSAVGFNADKTIAVVYIAHSCGGLCGGGGFAVLQKKAGKWQDLKWKGSSCMWES
jgi:hypothetical protein